MNIYKNITYFCHIIVRNQEEYQCLFLSHLRYWQVQIAFWSVCVIPHKNPSAKLLGSLQRSRLCCIFQLSSHTLFKFMTNHKMFVGHYTRKRCSWNAYHEEAEGKKCCGSVPAATGGMIFFCSCEVHSGLNTTLQKQNICWLSNIADCVAFLILDLYKLLLLMEPWILLFNRNSWWRKSGHRFVNLSSSALGFCSWTISRSTPASLPFIKINK